MLMKMWLVRLASFGTILILSAVWAGAGASADDVLQSPHYRFDESTLGGGGLIQSNSSNYQSSESVGDAAIGNSASTNYQVNAGSQTTNDPALTFTINTSTSNFGSFSPTATATSTSTFTVSDYTSYGYTVQIVGNPPSFGSHVLPAMATTGPAQTGIEQFGINLVANTSPSSFGANPDHGQFGIGSASANYATPNQFRYVSGETIASAPKSSGATTYTISYIVNVSSLTPGGQYTGQQQLVCIATF